MLKKKNTTVFCFVLFCLHSQSHFRSLSHACMISWKDHRQQVPHNWHEREAYQEMLLLFLTFWAEGLIVMSKVCFIFECTVTTNSHNQHAEGAYQEMYFNVWVQGLRALSKIGSTREQSQTINSSKQIRVGSLPRNVIVVLHFLSPNSHCCIKGLSCHIHIGTLWVQH